MDDSESEYSEDFEGSSREVSGRQNTRERPVRELIPEPLSDSETEDSDTEESEDDSEFLQAQSSSVKKNTTKQGHQVGDYSTSNAVESSFVSTVPTIKDTPRIKVAMKRGSNPTKINTVNPQRGKAVGTSKASTSKGTAFGTSPRDREMSACNIQVRKLASKVTYLGKQLEEFKKENRLLKRIQLRQEKELDSVNGNKGELPRMIHRHNEEVRYYKERLKQMKEVNDLLTRKLHSSEQSASALLENNNKLKKLNEEKKLLERDKLTQKLEIAQENLKKASAREKNLMHTNEMLLKKHETEYRFMEKKRKALLDQIEELTVANQTLSRRLKERERESEVLNIYTQKLGRPFPRIQPAVHVSKETQTEISLSSSKEIFAIPPSLSTSSTQTVVRKMDSTHVQTEALTPKKSETAVTSHDERSGSGMGIRQPTPHKTSVHEQSSQKPIQAAPTQFEQKEELQQLASDNSAKFNPVMLPSGPSGPLPKDTAKIGQVTAGNGTAQLKDEAEMKKKLLLSKLFTIGSETPPVSQSQKDAPVVASTNTGTVKELYGRSIGSNSIVATTVPATTVTSVSPSTVPVTRVSRQPGTSMSVLSVAATTAASISALSSKPWTNFPPAHTATSTVAAVQPSTVKPHTSTVPSIPFSSGPTLQSTGPNVSFSSIPVQPEISPIIPTSIKQSANPTYAPFTSSFQASTPNAQTSALTSALHNQTGPSASKGNSFAFGSTYTNVPKPQSQFSSALPVQSQFTSLASPAVVLGVTSQQNSSKTNVQQNAKKMDDDKKKDLLAKLTAIENRDDVPQENKGKVDSKGGSNQSSTSHLWPNTVENLHQGKHAYATEMDPYGSKILLADARKGQTRTSIPSLEKFNSGLGSGRHAKVESKSDLSTIDGNDLKRNTSGYSWENKVDGQSGKKGGIFADIMGQTSGTFNSQLGKSGTRVFGTGNSGVNSMRAAGQIRTNNTSYFN